MPSLLTHENLREELAAFAQGQLRHELAELGNAVRRGVSEEFQELQRWLVDTGADESSKAYPGPRSRSSAGDLGSMAAERIDGHQQKRLRRSSTDVVNPTFRASHAVPVDRPCVQSWATRVRSRTQDLGGSSQKYRNQTPVEDNDDDGFNIKALRSYKVVERLEGEQQAGSRRGSLMDTEKKKSHAKTPSPLGGVQLMRGISGGFTSDKLHLWGTSSGGKANTSVPSSPSGARRRGSSSLSPERSLSAGPADKGATAELADARRAAALARQHSGSSLAGAASERKLVKGKKISTVSECSSEAQESNTASMQPVLPASPKVSWAEPEGSGSEGSSGADEGSQDSKPPMRSNSKCAERSKIDVVTKMDGATVTSLGTDVSQARSVRRSSYGSYAPSINRGRCFQLAKAITESSMFNYFMGVVVAANLATVGLQTDHLARQSTETIPTGYIVVELIFCIIFVFELGLRVCANGLPFFYQVPGWKWNVFDALLVVLQLLHEVLDIIVANRAWEGSSYSFSFMRALRILRLIRIIRAVRILEQVRELQTIVLSIHGSIKSLCWTLLLLLLLIYIAGVYFTQVVTNYRVDNPNLAPDSAVALHCGSLGESILTLYSSIMGGIDWYIVVEPLVKHVSPALGIVYTLYVAFAVLAMMNVVTGVFVEASLKTAKEHHETFLLSHASNLFLASDLDRNGTVSWDEFESRLDDPHMQEFFKSIDVDVSEAQSVFHLLDVDDSGVLDLDQFMDGCLRLRGPAKAVDLSMLMHETKRMSRKHTLQMSILQNKLDKFLGLMPAFDQLTELLPHTPEHTPL
mmetsp:Transcript_62311/g.200895  ORF Transcript_62311/g.200895 Transcript_62311/m.200895 type:complete len:806 (+) Transcript_62311:139-2556(+)